ncbi:MAG: translation elongation factor Ts [Waddliaceae bacterium]
MSISMDLIKELRHKTGIGIGECKKALAESGGDMDEAIAYLRKKGLATAVKKEGREANEGKIGTASSNDAVAIVEVNSETDFVVQNQMFQEFVDNIANEVATTKPESLEAFLKQSYSKDASLTIEEYRAVMVQTIGENIQIKRFQILPKDSNHSIGVYSHLGGKIVTVVTVEGSDQEETLAKEIAMHAAATSPDYLKPEEVPEDIIQNERNIAKEQIKGKPENIIEKILDGKIKAYFDQVCLICQNFIRDDKLTISDLVNKRGKENGNTLQLTQFSRWKVGE